MGHFVVKGNNLQDCLIKLFKKVTIEDYEIPFTETDQPEAIISAMEDYAANVGEGLNYLEDVTNRKVYFDYLSEVVENLEKEFDEKSFENTINEYLDEHFEETYLFETRSGSFTEDGRIMLEGVLAMEEGKEVEVKFTLTPETNLTESLDDAVKFENYVVDVNEALKEIK